MKRNSLTVLAGLIPAILLLVLGVGLQVPFAALGPGPVVNTLGTVDNNQELITIEGAKLDTSQGQFDFTTVSVRSELSMLGALVLWASGDQEIVPVEAVYPPSQSREQTDRENVEAMQGAEDSAKIAAVRFLNRPVETIVKEVLGHKSESRGEHGNQSEFMVGDKIERVGDKTIRITSDVLEALEGTKAGQVIPVAINRQGVHQVKNITLGQSPSDSPNRGGLGVRLTTRPAPPLRITFNVEGIGGPSAGLMFALAIVDRLSPGDLTSGRKVAGTGTISADGKVGPIGGITHKLLGAQRAEATVFLVPEKNCAEALTDVPTGLQLIKVRDLADAVQSLEKLSRNERTPTCEAVK